MFRHHLLTQIIPVSARDLEANLRVHARWTAQIQTQQGQYTEYLSTPVTGAHCRSMLIQLYLLCFAHYFKDAFRETQQSSALSCFSSGRQFMSTQKKRMPIIEALSRNEWSFFERLSDVFLHNSPDKLKDPVDKSRFIRQAKPELLAVILMSRALYTDASGNAAEVYLEALKAIEELWLQSTHPIAHPQSFLTGHEVAALLNQKPGPQIGQVLNQLLDAQALSLVFDYESAVAYVKDLRTNNSE